MEAVFHAVIPVFGVIWLGYFFKRIQLPGDDFWPLAEKITYYVFLPSLFFLSILKADFNAIDDIVPLLLSVAVAMALTSALTFAAQYLWLKMDGKRFASFYQGSIRFNNYIGFPIIFSLFGHEGLVIYAIIIGLSIPLTNVLTVAVMTHYATDTRINLKKLCISIITNPLIVGPVAGLVVNLLHIPLSYAGDMIGFFANAASALGLLTVGAAIDFHAIRSSKLNLSVAVALKLIINPLLIWLACTFFGVAELERSVAVVYAALPVAVSSYILARSFGAHAALMASIIIITTLVSMGTLPLLLILSH